MRALLSLCNDKRTPDRGLLVYDFQEKSGSWIAVGAESEIMGTRGLCIHGGRVYALYTVGWYETHISIYALGDGPLEFLADAELPDVKDPHSLCVHEGRLLVASTGSDELLSYDLGNDGFPDDVAVAVWRASYEGSDTQHINSVASVGGHVYVSGFGKREGQFWSSAMDGFVLDVTGGSIVQSGLRHPHSLRGDAAGSLYYTESSRQTLCKVGAKPIIVGGYVRGCDIAPDGTAIVGSNAARRVSRSQGVVTNSANIENNEGDVVGKCSVVLVAPNAAATRQYYDISEFGKEIYDICALG